MDHKERQGVFNAIRAELRLRNLGQETNEDDGATAATA